MASSHCSRRVFSISSFKSAFRVRPTTNHSPLLNASSPHRQFSPLFTRNCVYQLGSVQSLLPLHSTVATSRLVSNLSIDSRNCQAVSQIFLQLSWPVCEGWQRHSVLWRIWLLEMTGFWFSVMAKTFIKDA